MKAQSDSFSIQTRGKGTYEITQEVARLVRDSGVQSGTVTVFLQHTSAFFERLVPEDTDFLVHTAEGPDDSTSHLKMVLTRSSETIPIMQGRMALGTWQGIFVFEHRRAPHRRTLVVSVVGV
jgi:thiamine phosphate synthase YjbQ (UPF0047 family)